MTLFDPPANDTVLPMPGLEPDNLLAFLALMGLLRALETSRPDWHPRVCWKGPPWVAQLNLATAVEEIQVAQAANEGIIDLVKHFQLDGSRKNVDFEREDYRRYARQVRDDAVAASLAAALTAEWPPKNNGELPASPLVMMFGQGHQNFLERLIDVPSGKLPNRLRKLKSPPDMTDPGKIAEALFSAWRRKDDADGFRWDPEEDQRYALRYRNPSPDGAAPTVLGANRPRSYWLCVVFHGSRRTPAAGRRNGARQWPAVLRLADLVSAALPQCHRGIPQSSGAHRWRA